MRASCAHSAHSIAAGCYSSVPDDWSDLRLYRHCDASVWERPRDRLPRNHCSCDSIGRPRECLPTSGDKSTPGDSRSQTPRSDECDGIKRPTASVDSGDGRRRTTVHPVRACRRVERATRCPPEREALRLFFNQAATVWRATPKMRSIPRRLGRS